MAGHILAGRWTARRGSLQPPVRAERLFRDQTPRRVKGSEALTLPPALVLTTARGGGQHKQLSFFFWRRGAGCPLGDGQPGLLTPPGLFGLISGPRLHSAQTFRYWSSQKAPPTGLSPLWGRQVEGSVRTMSSLRHCPLGALLRARPTECWVSVGDEQCEPSQLELSRTDAASGSEICFIPKGSGWMGKQGRSAHGAPLRELYKAAGVLAPHCPRVSSPSPWPGSAPPLGEAPPATRPPMAFLSLCLRLLSALVSPPSQQQPLFLNPLLPTHQASRPLLPGHLSGQPLPHSLSLPRPFRAGLLPHALRALSSQALSSAPIAFILTCRPEAQPHPWTTDLVQPLTEQPSSVSHEQGSRAGYLTSSLESCVSLLLPTFVGGNMIHPNSQARNQGSPLPSFPYPSHAMSPQGLSTTHSFLSVFSAPAPAPTGPPKGSLSIGVNLLGFRAQA